MSDVEKLEEDDGAIIREIISVEREYFFEKRNVKTERQRKIREIIERHVTSNDT